MSQTLHIFRKDTRRFWIEIGLSLLLQALFVLHSPVRWSFEPQQEARVALQYITLLLPLSWCLLIGRVILAEPLAGDDQFWITRPYEWPKLLAAKMLFVAAWIGLPYLFMQLAVLQEAGFAAHEYMGTALFSLLLLSGVVLLPLVAIATVTSNLTRYTLTLVGGVVAVVASSAAIGFRSNYSAANPLRDHFSFPASLAASCLVIVLIYATRRVLAARILVAAGAIAVFSISVLYGSQTLIDPAYAGGAAAPFAATLDTARSAATYKADRGFLYLSLPVTYSGVPEGYAALVENARITLTAADGSADASWTSPWQRNAESFLPIATSAHSTFLRLEMDPDTFRRFSHGPVTLHVTLGTTVLKADNSVTVPPLRDLETVPGLGVCSGGGSQNVLICRSVVRHTPFVSVGLRGSESACGGNLTTRQMWRFGGLGTDFESSLGPIQTAIMRIVSSDSSGQRWSICHTSPVTVTQYGLAYRTKVELTVPNFTLPPAPAGTAGQ